MGEFTMSKILKNKKFILMTSLILLISMISPMQLMKVGIATEDFSSYEDFTYGGIQDEESSHIEPTIDGGYIIVGYTKSYGAGEKDVWLLKGWESHVESIIWNYR